MPLYKAAPFDRAFNVTKKLDIEEVRLKIIVGPKVHYKYSIIMLSNIMWIDVLPKHWKK